jgi:hypothetical protein
MAEKRKTLKDYRNEFKELRASQRALEARLRKRATELCEQNPKIVIGANFGNPNQKEMLVFSKEYIGKMDNIGIDSVFSIIEIIETELANKHPHKQTEFDFQMKECKPSPDGKHHFEQDGEYCSYCYTNINNIK